MNHNLESTVCPSCGTNIHIPNKSRRYWTLSLSLAALILYVPANLLPFMSVEYYGAIEKNTIWTGIVKLWESHMTLVAIIVFIASILAPILKLLFLTYLSLIRPSPHQKKYQKRIYQGLKIVESWSMLDIFLLAILVSMLKLGQLVNVGAEAGAIAFGLMVVLTVLATQFFDPRSIEVDHERE